MQQLHIPERGKPVSLLMQIAALVIRWFDGVHTTGANLRGELPALVRASGFEELTETERWMTPFGTLAFVHARVF